MKEEYIPRSAVLSKTHDIHVKSKAGDVDFSHRCIDPSDVEEIPAADVRPVVRGKWEDVEVTYVADKTTLPFERISSMRCNQCNRYHTEIYYYGNPTEMANFCPNCGAWMAKRNRGDEDCRVQKN